MRKTLGGYRVFVKNGENLRRLRLYKPPTLPLFIALSTIRPVVFIRVSFALYCGGIDALVEAAEQLAKNE